MAQNLQNAHFYLFFVIRDPLKIRSKLLLAQQTIQI